MTVAVIIFILWAIVFAFWVTRQFKRYNDSKDR
jgi:hypothetical protein